MYEHIYRVLALEIGISELCHMRFLLVWIYDARITPVKQAELKPSCSTG